MVDLRLQEMSSDEEAAEVAATGAKNHVQVPIMDHSVVSASLDS